ncbi:MAG: hypothetical protein ABIO36_05770 [Pyrinomonadaceae bacterium]
MTKIIIGLIIGIIVGGALTFYFFVGVPRAAQIPGSPIQPPDPNVSAGAAQIVLRQEFFNEVLKTIFRDMNDPAFPLSVAGNAASSDFAGPRYAAFQESPTCDGKITILPEGSGVQTAVRFENNRISAPLAFSGSYNSLFGCLQFTGWAQANLALRFDQTRQTVFGQINVETVNLDGVNPIIGALVTPLVQTTINNRVNPIQILQGKQIALNVPIASTGGNLQASVTDVRAEFNGDALNLYVIYAFNGTPLN